MFNKYKRNKEMKFMIDVKNYNMRKCANPVHSIELIMITNWPMFA